MTVTVPHADVRVGTRLPTRHCGISRDALVMFCGAALDFVGPHWNERIARSVGWADVIAHRALITAKVLIPVREWLGDPTAIIECHTRYLHPVYVPDDDAGARLRVDGVVADKGTDGTARIDLTVTTADGVTAATVEAVVRLA